MGTLFYDESQDYSAELHRNGYCNSKECLLCINAADEAEEREHEDYMQRNLLIDDEALS